AIDCKTVDSALLPCVPYLTGGGTPTTDCCKKGVTTIKDISVTTQQKDACNCVKAAANRYPTLKDEVARALPDMCKVKLDIPISRTTNCDAI
uniref:Non-specific lipid-transfer protein 1 n=1 Tax=Trachyspermum ammi TaxID=52570 RepID=NLTP1_TRAAM|nr:RecName: Full=Non-specific lipid-transfer protein 1; Short=LTP1; Short=nsLTP1 [Trachyspermum ammi]